LELTPQPKAAEAGQAGAPREKENRLPPEQGTTAALSKQSKKVNTNAEPLSISQAKTIEKTDSANTSREGASVRFTSCLFHF